MRLLIDTQAFLWFAGNDPKLSTVARGLIEDPSNDLLLSAASVWELAIKLSIGKLRLSEPLKPFLQRQLPANAIDPLPVLQEHAEHVVTLPFHHRDPFDRLLVAQCLIENLPIISIDGVLDAYGVVRYW
jgi:PIN domain nuclease of toxin-antitoxin system